MFYRLGRKSEKSPRGGGGEPMRPPPPPPPPPVVRLRVKTQYVEVAVTQINRFCNQMFYSWYRILVGKAQSAIPRPRPHPSIWLFTTWVSQMALRAKAYSERLQKRTNHCLYLSIFYQPINSSADPLEFRAFFRFLRPAFRHYRKSGKQDNQDNCRPPNYFYYILGDLPSHLKKM